MVAVSAFTRNKSTMLTIVLQSYMMIMKIIHDNLPPMQNMWMRRFQTIVSDKSWLKTFNDVFEEIKKKRPNDEETTVRKEATFRYVKRRNLAITSQLQELGIDFSIYEDLDLAEILDHARQRSATVEDSPVRQILADYCREMEAQGTLVKAPYLPDPPAKAYTLVLDLDETLLHFEELNDDES